MKPAQYMAPDLQTSGKTCLGTVNVLLPWDKILEHKMRLDNKRQTSQTQIQIQLILILTLCY